MPDEYWFPPKELLDEVKTSEHKRLSHVGVVKSTQENLSEVRTKESYWFPPKEMLDEVKTSEHKRLSHVGPVSKQDLLSSVRKESATTKKRLSHIEPKVEHGAIE